MTIIQNSLLNRVIEHWKLDEASGNRSGAFAGLTLTDNGTVGSTTGKQGNAARFVAASSERLSLTNPSQFDGLQSLSVNMWVNPTATGLSGEQMLWSVWQHTVNNQIMLTITATQIGCYIGHTTCANFNYDAGGKAHGMTAGNWYMVTYVFGRGLMTYYVNGVNLGTSTHTATAIQTCAADMHIGARHGPIAADFFDGDIDEVTTWSRRLSDEEVKRLYNNAEGLAFPFNGTTLGRRITMRPRPFTPSRAR